MDRKEFGRMGEEIAMHFLKEKGFEIIEQNYRYGHGEIDLIAKDPQDGFTVFIEVKARNNLDYGEPEYAITKSKQKQIRKIAGFYLQEKGIEELDCRFDVISILLENKNNPSISHYINAFP